MPVRSSNRSRLANSIMAAERFYKVRIANGPSGPVPYSQLLDLRSVQTLNQRASNETTAEFLQGLPSYHEDNFARFQPDTSCKNTMKKSAVYFPSKDHPCEQIITTEKTTILLRYLQQHYEKKRAQMKRETEKAGPSGASGPVPKKKSRMQNSQV